MEKKNHFTQKQKLDILESAKEIGIKEAGDLAGIHYTTAYQWQRKLEVLGEEAFLAYLPKSRSRGIKKVTDSLKIPVSDRQNVWPITSKNSIVTQVF